VPVRVWPVAPNRIIMKRKVSRTADNVHIPLSEAEALRLMLKVKPTAEMPRPGANPTKKNRAKKEKEMGWYKGTMTPAEVVSGKAIRMQEAFEELFLRFAGPRDAALFSSGPMRNEYFFLRVPRVSHCESSLPLVALDLTPPSDQNCIC
jgi:hypothetical protein